MEPRKTFERVTIQVGENHRYHAHSAYMAVLEFLYYHRVHSAIVTRGIAGFDPTHRLRSADVLALSEDLPVKIEFIESVDKAEALLPKIRDMIGDGTIAIQPAEMYPAPLRAPQPGPQPAPHLRLEGRAKLMRIYVNEGDRWHAKPLHEALVEALRANDIAGVTVYRGIAGYGAGGRLHKDRTLNLSHDRPIMLSVVDTEEKIRGFLPVLDGMIVRGLVALSDVEVIKYTHGPAVARDSSNAEANR